MADATIVSPKPRLIPFDDHDMDEDDIPEWFDYGNTLALVGGGFIGLTGIVVAAIVVYTFRNRHD